MPLFFSPLPSNSFAVSPSPSTLKGSSLSPVQEESPLLCVISPSPSPSPIKIYALRSKIHPKDLSPSKGGLGLDPLSFHTWERSPTCQKRKKKLLRKFIKVPKITSQGPLEWVNPFLWGCDEDTLFQHQGSWGWP
jgi:hypothetical protein